MPKCSCNKDVKNGAKGNKKGVKKREYCNSCKTIRSFDNGRCIRCGFNIKFHKEN